MRHFASPGRLAGMICLVALTGALGQSWAQVNSTPPRIVGAVSDKSLFTIPGSVHPLARAEFDRGPAPAEAELTNVRLVFARSAEQRAALDKLLAEQVDSSSPNYHKWLTPEQFGRRFGPADSDIAAVTAWLQSHGLKVNPIPAGRSDISFNGTAAQVAEALHTSIHQYSYNGESFYANSTAAKIPAAFRNLISGVANLNTIRPRPMVRMNPQAGQIDTQTHRLSMVNSVVPEFTPSSGGLFVVPQDAATIYDTPNSFNANFSSGTAYNGTGVKIGIAGRAVIKASTVTNYRQLFMNDTKAPNIINIDATSSADEGEAYLDVEVSGALAPGASIYYYTSQNLFNSISTAINDNNVDILSISYGACEMNLGSGNQYMSQLTSQAAAQGITITVSTGDNGSAGCDNQDNQFTAHGGLQINGLASTPYNIAVGGTDYIALLSNPGQYLGSNRSLYGSALGYIPEATWNNSVQQDGTLAQNVPLLDTTSNESNIWGGSGGRSSCVTQNTNGSCAAGYTKPSWQRGPGVPADGVRDVPDVALMAGSGNDNASWLTCTDDQVQGTSDVRDCSTQPDGGVYFQPVGGTSAAAPAFAGILALLEQKVGSRLGTDALKNLYDLQAGSHASAVFHDVTVGNNSMPCDAASPNCAANNAGNNYLTGYDTTTAYDLATGLGSVDATQLINFWGMAATVATPTITITPDSTTVTTAQGFHIAVTVSGTAGTPTGTVTLKYGTASTTGTLDGSGSYSFAIAGGTLKAGSVTFTADYSGDTNYAAASTTTAVTVTALTPTVSLTPSSATIDPSQSVAVRVDVTGSGATPTGTVSLSGGGYSATAQALAGGVYTFNIPAGSLAVGTDTLTATYSGDNIYATGAGTTVVTVTGGTGAATVSLTPSATTIFTSQALTVKAAVGGTGAAAPTGTVSLTGGGYSVGAQTLVGGSYTFNIPANSLNAGNDTLTVSYSGDKNYATSSSQVKIAVTAASAAAATVTVTPAMATIASSQALDVPVAVAGNGTIPTGTVTLSSGTYTSSAATLTAGAATISIPANSLGVGTDTLTVTYNGDSFYAKTTGSASVKVNAAYSIAGPSTTTSIGKGSSGTATITVTADKSYSGTLTLSCAVTSSPANATDQPTCDVSSGSSISVTNGTPSGTATLTINSTAAQTAMQRHTGLPGWVPTGGGAMLALVAFFGIPARRRALRSLLGMLVLVLVAGSLSACGGSGGSNTPVTPTDPGTTSGNYVFTVTATGSPAVNPAPTATVNVTIN